MKSIQCDIAVIGAGAAGLMATSELKRMGFDVVCLEAANRVGGRILTIHDPMSPIAIELGAEFVHGLPEEIWSWIHRAGLGAYERSVTALHLQNGHVQHRTPTGELADRLLKNAEGKRGAEESFEQLLSRSRYNSDIKSWARIHIEGFNAARSELVSVNALVKDGNAAKKIEGDRLFRLPGGYDCLIDAILHSIPDYHQTVHLDSIVGKIRWRRGKVDMEYRSALDGQPLRLRCRKAIITVPLGVLQAKRPGVGAIEFDPIPAAAMKAAAALRFGQVYRITLRFAEAFWENRDAFKRSGFWISKEPSFGTWWNSHPFMAPVLTGWMAGSAAERFRSHSRSSIEREAIQRLGRVLHCKIPTPLAFYFHNWCADPLFRGAYSYVPVNAASARQRLSTPLEDTLYFAGEAAARNGNAGTVHGALSSGKRAARLAGDSGKHR